VTPELVAVVAAGGAVGAPTRFLVDRVVRARVGSDVPWGTIAVNMSGSVILGLLTGLALGHRLGPVPVALVGTGFCGAYTTFSTFTFETLELLERGEVRQAATNVSVSLVAGLGAAACGLALGLAF
jgi:CrcB protein